MSVTNKTKSFKIPSSLELDMQKKVVADGYGLRGKSKWICDAILKLLQFSDEEFVHDCIEYADGLQRLDKSVSFRPTTEVDNLLRDWVVKVRKRVPTMEGVKSNIIRASIMQSILGSVDTMRRLEALQNDLEQ